MGLVKANWEVDKVILAKNKCRVGLEGKAVESFSSTKEGCVFRDIFYGEKTKSLRHPSSCLLLISPAKQALSGSGRLGR